MTVATQLKNQTVITLLMDNDRTYHRPRLPALHMAAKTDDVRAAKLLLDSDSSTTNVGLLTLHYFTTSCNLAIRRGTVEEPSHTWLRAVEDDLEAGTSEFRFCHGLEEGN